MEKLPEEQEPEMHNYCDSSEHEWQEVYYGVQCKKCGQFYANGCAPWEEEYEPNW